MKKVSTINAIESSQVYRDIMRDSYGGIMYDVANAGKYQAEEIMRLWRSASPTDREGAGGVMKGAFDFLEQYQS
ncbi:hypothetical protein [Dietzia cinnamea]|uniref:hypothetical protein n=1 Tax=Dietzia cinnamea TaxID=321318 RepID=UPI00223BEAF8|nr:hypothetical protein [Dietzia cinnamea]MCT2077680.1 hypothetical protein [Dietzia cinnamea]MCT2221959.1 hypothetical protein [Dietzia cinnamea]